MSEPVIKDSGTRRGFGTGAVRDAATQKGRFDLLPFDALQQIAIVFEEGGRKYRDRNWELGIPVGVYIDSAMRHLAKAASGMIDEPHLPMAGWNVMCAIQTAMWVQRGELPPSMAYDKMLSLFGAITPTRATETGELLTDGEKE